MEGFPWLLCNSSCVCFPHYGVFITCYNPNPSGSPKDSLLSFSRTWLATNYLSSNPIGYPRGERQWRLSSNSMKKDGVYKSTFSFVPVLEFLFISFDLPLSLAPAGRAPHSHSLLWSWIQYAFLRNDQSVVPGKHCGSLSLPLLVNRRNETWL